MMEGNLWNDLKKTWIRALQERPTKNRTNDLYKDGEMLRDFALCCIISMHTG